MDEQQRQRLANALQANDISLRQASLATREPITGKPLFGETYVRDMIKRGRGTKENLELICAANGISFDFVWYNRSGMRRALATRPTTSILPLIAARCGTRLKRPCGGLGLASMRPVWWLGSF